MNRRIVVGFAAALLAACSQAQPGSDPVSAIEPLYAPYVEGRNPAPWYDAAPWTAEMRGLIERLEQAERDGDGAVIDFDPIIDGQDWQFDAVAVTLVAPAEEGRAEVQARFTNMGAETTVIYEMADEGGWRVNNIRTENWSLREILASAGIAPEAE